jgi:capsular polysaccharide biosynthesis protein
MKKYLPIIFIAFAVSIFFLVIDPQYEEVQKLNKQKNDNDTMLQLAQDLQRQRDILQVSYNNIGIEERRNLEKLLPDTVDNVRLVLDINNIAEQYGISIQNIDISKENSDTDERVASSVERSSDIGTISLGFTITSTYEVFINFMKDLEEALRVVDIKSLNISPAQGVFMNYEVVIDTYWLR